MSTDGSVTHWINQLKTGDQDAAQKLWERYVQRLVQLAGQRLHGPARRSAGPEDVTQSAFASFFSGFARDRFPLLHDRDDLWQLLVVITTRKAVDRFHHERRQKRGGGKVSGESALEGAAGSSAAGRALEQVIGSEPTPEFAAQVAEEYLRLLSCLHDAGLEAVAQLKLEGYTNAEIAAQLDCSLRTVERRVRLIRGLWKSEELDDHA